MLLARHPFDLISEATVTGCPECFDVDSFVYVCDEDNCDRPVSCGTPTSLGYRSTCSEHAPKSSKVKHLQ